MALTKIQGGWFDPVVHAYYDEGGKWVPSSTQCLSLVGLSNYKFVKQEVLDVASERGTQTHDLTATLDRHGAIDPSWIPENCVSRVAAYELFKHERHFVPEIDWIEKSIIATIYGMKVGITPDRFGKLDGYDAVVELKCIDSALSTWGYQTAIQEMGIYKSNLCGRAQRLALQLKSDGRYHIDPHKNHSRDQSIAVAALSVVWARLDSGEKVWECV